MKNIRFNLKFFNGDSPFDSVRSMLELRQKFNLDDLYEYFISGQLERWLRCHDEHVIADKIKAIDSKQDITCQVSKLFDALEFGVEDNRVKESVASFLYPRKILNQRAKLQDALSQVNLVIEKNYAEYESILRHLVESREDIAEVKSTVRLMLAQHGRTFALDYVRFYDLMIRECPLAIFAVLMDDKYRAYYMPQNSEREAIHLGALATLKSDKNDYCLSKYISERLKSLLHVTTQSYSTPQLSIDGQNISEENYLFKSGAIKHIADFERGRGAWQDELDETKRIMILWNAGVEIRPYHDNTNQYKPGDLNAKFHLMNGLEFRTSSSGYDCCVYYIEV